MINELLNQTVNADVSSTKLNMEQSKGVSIQANISGGITTGDIVLQVSNDGTNWIDVSGSSKSLVSPTAIYLYWDLVDQFAEYVRADLRGTIVGSSTVLIISKKKR